MDTLSQPSTQTLSNLGIGAGLVAVPESRVYRTADGSRTAYYRAGDQITRAEAELYGIVDPVAVSFVGDDAAHGERIAGYLQAAGFPLAKAEELLTTEAEIEAFDFESAEFGETVAAALRAAGYELRKGRRTDVDGVAVPVAEVELGTLVASETATREAAQTAGGQTEGHVTVPAGEAKQEPEAPANKAEGTPANKAEPKPATKKG